MQIIYDEGQRPAEGLAGLFLRAAGLALEREGIEPGFCEISFTFVSTEEMRALNAMHRGKDEPTDVLSFPMYESAAGARETAAMAADEAGPPALLGDVAVCLEVVEMQAAEAGRPAESELVHIFAHSMLHLLGYSHETEEDFRAMREAEEGILRDCGVKI